MFLKFYRNMIEIEVILKCLSFMFCYDIEKFIMVLKVKENIILLNFVIRVFWKF